MSATNGHITFSTALALAAVGISGFSMVNGIIGNQRTDLRDAIQELKTADHDKLSINEHNEFKRQIESRLDRIERNLDSAMHSISELLVKKDVFEAYVAAQTRGEALVLNTNNDKMKAINDRIDRQRADIKELIDIVHQMAPKK